MTKRFRLTTGAKILIAIIIAAVVGGGIWYGMKSGLIKNDIKPVYDENGNVMNTVKDRKDTINVSLDEWIGWESILYANGGLKTEEGSIYDQLGIDVNISVINDPDQSSKALLSGNTDAAGYTINRAAVLSQMFTDAGVDVIMPYITNFSNGGDGIIANSSVNSVQDLVDARIGVPYLSEAHSLVVWFVNRSDLSQADKDKIINNLIFFDTPDEAALAMFAGEIDVAATWEPYLTQAQDTADAHILFSTASSSSLIMDGILFNKAFAEANPEVVSKFIKGSLMAHDMYGTKPEIIRRVMPGFATMSDAAIKEQCAGAKLTTYADNINLFNGTAKTIYLDMCGVWESIGETVNRDLVNTLYDDKYIKALENDFPNSEITQLDHKPVITEENKDDIIDAEALLQKSATVNFIINTSKFTNSQEASATLNEFIEIAKVLDGTIIEIAGNTDPNPYSDPDDSLNKILSESRAEAVKQYFILNGIAPERIISIGNGSSNPIVPNDTDEHKAMNRRTDVSFKIIEG